MASACDSVDWNPIGSAGSHSQLAGVVAGLVFAGIIVILERRSPTRRSAEALTLFVAGFFTFALDSFFFAVVAGERTCPRAWTETMVAAGMLGFGALSLLTGVAWLLFAHGEYDSTPFRVTRVIAYTLALIVVGQLTVTARDYLRDVRPQGYYGWIDWLLNGCLALIILVIVLHIVFGQRIGRFSRLAVELAAYVSIAYILVCALSFGVLTGVDVSYWEGPTRPVVYVTATLLSVIFPGLVVVVQLLALPRHEPTVPALTTPTQKAPTRPDLTPEDQTPKAPARRGTPPVRREDSSERR